MHRPYNRFRLCFLAPGFCILHLDPFATTAPPGESLLHRLDPRLKLLGFPLLTVAAFSAAGALRAAVLVFLALSLLLLAEVDWRRWWRSVRMLRWLLLGTVLLHLFLSPGRTLWGIAWLSRDGLERGGLVALQLVLAVTFSLLLTLTTTPRQIAAALASLLAPWRRRLPVRDLVLQLLLVIRFIPILREEAAAQVQDAGGDGSLPADLPGRCRFYGALLAPLLLRLVDRADDLARRAAGGEDIWGEKDLPPLHMRSVDRWAAAFGILLLILLFGVLP